MLYEVISATAASSSRMRHPKAGLRSCDDRMRHAMLRCSSQSVVRRDEIYHTPLPRGEDRTSSAVCTCAGHATTARGEHIGADACHRHQRRNRDFLN